MQTMLQMFAYFIAGMLESGRFKYPYVLFLHILAHINTDPFSDSGRGTGSIGVG
jgi:hypothetical protein